MTVRSRERERSFLVPVIGTYQYTGSSGSHTDTRMVEMGSWESCDDIVGNWEGDNPFQLLRYSKRYPVLNGTNSVPPVTHKFEDYPIDYRVEPRTDFPASWKNPDLVSIAHVVASATNPARESVNVPQFLGEMRDWLSFSKALGDLRTGPVARTRLDGHRRLRGMQQKLKSLARAAGYTSDVRRFGVAPAVLRGAARANLTYRFALAPTVSDLRKLVTFQELAERKAQWLMTLDKRPLYTRLELPSDSREYVDTDGIVHSYNATIHAKVSKMALKQWATCRWIRDPLRSALFERAGSKDIVNPHVRGLDLALATNNFGAIKAAWELIPWSWLHDWYADFGAWLGANNNSYPVTLESICYMSTMSSRTSMVDVQKPAWVGLHGEYHVTHEEKLRIPIPRELLWIPPLTSVEAMTASQFGILGSLAILGSL